MLIATLAVIGRGDVSAAEPYRISKSDSHSSSSSSFQPAAHFVKFVKFEHHSMIIFSFVPGDVSGNETRAINPTTLTPYVFWFVNNTSVNSGDGTFESPFNNLTDAQNSSQPNDIIYVFAGDGTDTRMNAGISLQQGQQLLGSGVRQKVKTTEGLVCIHKLSIGIPVISNTLNTTNLNAVFMDQGDNTVSGFTLVDNIGAQDLSGGVRVDAGLNYVIKNNTASTFGDPAFAPTTGNGININGGGNIVIKNNTIISRDGVSDTFGISCSNFTAAYQGFYVIKNNHLTGADASTGFSSGIVIEPFDTTSGGAGIIGDLKITVIGNTVDSQTNSVPAAVDAFKSGILLAGHAPANNPITWIVKHNHVNIPAGIADPYAGIGMRSHGPGAFIATYHDNVSITVPPTFGYVFNNFGNPAFLDLYFGSDNVGTRSGP